MFLPTALFPIIAVSVAFGATSVARSQAQSQTQSKSSSANAYEYDVVSIRLSPPAARLGVPGIVNTPDGLTAKSVRLWGLIRQAYGAERILISGAPKWFDTEFYDIDARIDSSLVDEFQKLGSAKSQIQRQQMLQALLADRFKLTFHRETKELPAYFLVIAKNGPKLKSEGPEYVGPSDFDGPDGNRATDTVTITKGGTVIAQAASVETLANALSVQLGRPVLDKTGLTGRYDFTFKFSPDRIQPAAPPDGAANGEPVPVPPDPNGPSLSGAIQEHLGLKLESGKGPVEIFVIDHVERPSGN
jgi:uncharacterized protein (TIGR03435 family)